MHGRETEEAPKAIQEQIAELRNRLITLTALEDSLASYLSGGVTFGSSRRPGAFVRSGWQSVVGGSTQNDVQYAGTAMRNAEVPAIAAKLLANSVQDVQALWEHPSVKLLVHNRKVRVEDSASL